MNAPYNVGDSHDALMPKPAVSKSFWVGLIIAEAAVALVLVTIFSRIADRENQIATWPMPNDANSSSPPRHRAGGGALCQVVGLVAVLQGSCDE